MEFSENDLPEPEMLMAVVPSGGADQQREDLRWNALLGKRSRRYQQLLVTVNRWTGLGDLSLPSRKVRDASADYPSS